MEDQKRLAFLRTCDEESLLIVLNWGEGASEWTLPLPNAESEKRWVSVLDASVLTPDEPGVVVVRVDGYGFNVYQRINSTE